MKACDVQLGEVVRLARLRPQPSPGERQRFVIDALLLVTAVEHVGRTTLVGLEDEDGHELIVPASYLKPFHCPKEET